MILDSTLAGVDGCGGGWVIVQQSSRTEAQISWRVYETLDEFFAGLDVPDLVAVDIPIGLPARGARACDREARRLLGPTRGCSVFPAPIRQLLDAHSHAEACEIRFEVEAKRISLQTWGIVPKIREVDRLLRRNREARDRVREVHPELCFYFMNGERPVELSKKTRAGRDERARLLRLQFGSVIDDALHGTRLPGCSADDLLDAFAALWTARRIADGRSVRIPELPERDENNLSMEIVA